MPSFPANQRHPSAHGARLLLLAAAVLSLAVSACGSDNNPGPGGTAPTLVSNTPADTATAVPLNAHLTATFDMAMQALTASNFTLKQGATAVAGAVSNSADGTVATFTPSANLAASTAYTATITAGTKSAAGGSFAADRSWSFTTGTTADTTAPTVTETNPVANATGVAINSKVLVTFSEAIDPTTINATNFTVKQGTTAVPGAVTYGPGLTATFTPTAALTSSVLFTATLSTGVKDLQGNALAAPFTWNFTTGTTTARGPAPVGLGAAGNFVILAKTAISTVPASAVTGDIGVSPAAATFITGFSLIADSTNVFSTSTQITGKAFAANYAVPTPSNLTTSVSNMEAAYTDAAGRVTPDFTNFNTGNLGGQTLVPGLYKFGTSVTIPADVTISGGPNDTWIFQISNDLIMTGAKNVTLAGGALAKNIVWQVAGQATFGAGAHFEGVLLVKTQATLQTGASMNGRILAQTQVSLDHATVVKPAP